MSYLELHGMFADSDDRCLSDPCGSHGTCVDLSDSYHCICDAGYTGYNCNHSICEDNSSPCENNSTCSLCEEGVCISTGLSFQCECVDDFYGVLCTDRKFAVNNHNLDLRLLVTHSLGQALCGSQARLPT